MDLLLLRVNRFISEAEILIHIYDLTRTIEVRIC